MTIYEVEFTDDTMTIIEGDTLIQAVEAFYERIGQAKDIVHWTEIQVK